MAPHRRLKIENVDIRVLDYPSALTLLSNSIANGVAEAFSFVNAHSVNLARRFPDFSAALQRMTLLNDGIGVALASRILMREPLPANLNGTDFIPALLAVLPRGTRVYLLGGSPGVAEQACVVFAQRYPTLAFVGAMHGFFGEQDCAEIVRRIVATRAQLVIVAMGQPRQEIWAIRNVVAIGAVILCGGAILDFTVGRFRRAPRWIQALKLEWAFRLALEPKRLARRYLLGNASFMFHVLLQRYRH